MIVASYKELSVLFDMPLPSQGSWEHSIVVWSQQCNFYEFLLHVSLPGDEFRYSYAQSLRKARCKLANALANWEVERAYVGCWEGWPLTI